MAAPNTVRMDPIVPPTTAVPPIASAILNTCNTLLSEQCCHKFLVDFDFSNQECLKFALSKGLGYSIIVASTLVKLPQLLKIFSARSGAGISVLGTFLELLAITFNAAYSYGKRYPFTAWGEALFLLVETGLIAFLVLWYDRRRVSASVFVVLYAALFYGLMSGMAPIAVLWQLQACNLPLAVSGKLLQVYRNVKNGHTGQMSFITVTLLTLGCLARIFTSIQETGDQLVVVTYTVAAAANFLQVAQVLYYWTKTNAFLAKQSKKKHK